MVRFCLGIVLALCALPAGAQWLPAYVPNASFELDVNRDKTPDGWSTAFFRSPGKAAWETGVAHTGTHSVRLSDSKDPADQAWDANTARWVQESLRSCVPGETLLVDGWVKTDLTEGRARIDLCFSGGGKWLREIGTPAVSGRTDWQHYSASVEVPAGAETVGVYLKLDAGVGSVWFDDITVAPGGKPQGNFRPIDLRAACTTGFADEVAGDGKGGWTDQGDNDAREIPLGRQVWRTIPFDIIDPVTNGGRSCILLRGRGREQMPAAAEFPVNQRCDVLYFLQADAWAGSSEAVVARYVVTFADGSTVTVPLRNGREILDWWGARDSIESALGWQGKNAQSPSIGLCIYPWRNPKPDLTIARVRLEKAGGDAVPILVAVTAGDGPPLMPELPLKLEFTDTTGWYEWNFDLKDPTLREIDLSSLLDAPAGKHGFLTVGKDGHFYFQDGVRARFFGTNTGGAGCCPDKAAAEMVAERLSRYGINLLRLHSIDGSYTRFIDYAAGTTQTLNPEMLDRYDYFVAQLLKRGIYVYFDLLDYRQFLPGDGVRDAGQLQVRWENSIKGASIFDERMLQLQKDYATALLTHLNPYTGRRYVDEPGLAVQEITNENSLFYLQNQKLMLPSYVADLEARWNRWLLEQYKDRAGLARAWTRGQECALLADEDPARSTVVLPLRFLHSDLSKASYVGEQSPARCNDMQRFLYGLETAYYNEMIGHLRSLGLKCPITGTNQDFCDASNAANAQCDFTSRNNYWCHPDVDAKPFMRFNNLAMVSSDLAARSNPVAEVASSTVVGKPMIVPEFNFPWPNEWRCEALPLMAAYGRLQDWDGLLYFAYSANETRLTSFGNQSDPVRWGQMPLAALIFLRGDIEVARNTWHVGVSEVDRFSTRRGRGNDGYSFYRVLPYISRVRNTYFDDRYSGDADVVVSSGHSATGDFSQARHALVFADWPFSDVLAKSSDRGLSSRLTVPGLQTKTLAPPVVAALGNFDTVLDPGTLPPGAEPIRAGDATVGFLSDRQYVMPHASGQAATDPAWLHRMVLQAATRWKLPSQAPLEEAGRVFRSDTGQLVLDRTAGLFTAVAPCVRVALGQLGGAGKVALGEVGVECKTPFASVSIVSLDGLPVASSRRLLVTAVARSENTGQAFLDGHRAIPENGRAPVLVEPVDCRLTLPWTGPAQATPLTPKGEKATTGQVLQSGSPGALILDLAGAHSPWVLVERG